jgi:hypothetical protein
MTKKRGRSLMRAKTVLLALALAACGEAEQRPEIVAKEPVQPAAPMSIHDMLVDCAGAIAAEGNVDPLVEPSTGSGAENALWTVLALMDKEPGLFGVAGRQAAAQSKKEWQAKAAPERTARAAECTQRFAGG